MGLDDLLPKLFKQLTDCISLPLSIDYTQFLSVAAVPDELKHKVIMPVFKKGAAEMISNY
jgi:hypothetical protein